MTGQRIKYAKNTDGSLSCALHSAKTENRRMSTSAEEIWKTSYVRALCLNDYTEGIRNTSAEIKS